MTRATLLRKLAPGRRVECNVRGRRFWAVLVERTEDGWRVEPPKACSHYHVTTRQIVAVDATWTPEATQLRGGG